MNLRIILKIAEAFIFLMYCGMHLCFSNSWQRIPQIIHRTGQPWKYICQYNVYGPDISNDSWILIVIRPEHLMTNQLILVVNTFFSRNPLDPQIEVIKFHRDEAYSLQNAMLQMGFTINRIGLYDILQPCSLGTFSKANGKCTECPPGLFQQIHCK